MMRSLLCVLLLGLCLHVRCSYQGLSTATSTTNISSQLAPTVKQAKLFLTKLGATLPPGVKTVQDAKVYIYSKYLRLKYSGKETGDTGLEVKVKSSKHLGKDAKQSSVTTSNSSGEYAADNVIYESHKSRDRDLRWNNDSVSKNQVTDVFTPLKAAVAKGPGPNMTLSQMPSSRTMPNTRGRSMTLQDRLVSAVQSSADNSELREAPKNQKKKKKRKGKKKKNNNKMKKGGKAKRKGKGKNTNKNANKVKGNNKKKPKKNNRQKKGQKRKGKNKKQGKIMKKPTPASDLDLFFP